MRIPWPEDDKVPRPHRQKLLPLQHIEESQILSGQTIIIPLLIPLALRGVAYKPIGASALLRRNLFIYGLGGIIVPFIGIKLIDMLVSVFF